MENKTSKPTSSNINQTSDLNAVKTGPSTPSLQTVKKSSPLSSCSNSPSSVRINQNYNPKNVEKSPIDGSATNHINHTVDCDLENGDSEPLLDISENNTQITTNIKRTNNRYEKSDEGLIRKADSDNESETLIKKSQS